MSLIVPAIFNFGLVVFILWFFGRKPMGAFLVQRSEAVSTEIDIAQKESTEASHFLNEWESNWKSCEAHAKQALDDAQTAMVRTREMALSSAKTEAERVRKDAVLAGNTETSRAKEGLQRELVEKSVRMARTYLEKNITEKDRHSLVTDYVERVTGNGSH